MDLNELQDAGINVFDAVAGNDFPFLKTWKKTFKVIEQSLKDFGDEEKKDQILGKITNIINLLVRFGDTEEDLVLETAQLYIFVKEAGLDVEILRQSYSKFVIDGVCCLCQTELENIKKQVFENENYKYLGKIKIAEYLVELVSNASKGKLIEVDEIIKLYKNKSNKKLMNMLIEERKNQNK